MFLQSGTNAGNDLSDEVIVRNHSACCGMVVEERGTTAVFDLDNRMFRSVGMSSRLIYPNTVSRKPGC